MVRLTYYLEPAVTETQNAVPVNLAFAAAAAARASWASKDRAESVWDTTQSSDDDFDAPSLRAGTVTMGTSNIRPESGQIMRSISFRNSLQIPRESNGYNGVGSDVQSVHTIPRNSVVYHTAQEEKLTSTTLMPTTKVAPSVGEVTHALESRYQRGMSLRRESGGTSPLLPFEAGRRPSDAVEVADISIPGCPADGLPHRATSEMPYFGRASDTAGFGSLGGAVNTVRWSALTEALTSGAEGDELPDALSPTAADGEAADGERDGCLVLPVLRTLLALQGEGGGGRQPSGGKLSHASNSLHSFPATSSFSRAQSQAVQRSSTSQVQFVASATTLGAQSNTYSGGSGGGGGSPLPRQSSNNAALVRRRTLMNVAGDGSIQGGSTRMGRSVSRSFHSMATSVADEEADLDSVSRAHSCTASTSTSFTSTASTYPTVGAVAASIRSHQAGRSGQRALTATGIISADSTVADAPIRSTTATTAAEPGDPAAAAAASRVPNNSLDASPPSLRQQLHHLTASASASSAQHLHQSGAVAVRPAVKPQPPPGEPPKRLFSWTKNLSKGKWLWSGGGGGSSNVRAASGPATAMVMDYKELSVHGAGAGSAFRVSGGGVSPGLLSPQPPPSSGLYSPQPPPSSGLYSPQPPPSSGLYSPQPLSSSGIYSPLPPGSLPTRAASLAIEQLERLPPIDSSLVRRPPNNGGVSPVVGSGALDLSVRGGGRARR